MEQVIWVEILSRQLGVIARHRCTAPEIRIGRGYDNDIVLDDPSVAAAHLRIARNADGVLMAEDLGSANGLYAGHAKERVQRVAIDAEQPLRIGNTLLRVREASYQVAPAKVERTPHVAISTVAAIGVVTLLLQLLILWLNETTEPRFASYLPTLLGVPAVALVWTASWALLCRIFSGQARFIRNLFIAFSVFLAYTLVTSAAALVAFGFSWHPIANYQYAIAWCFLAAICVLHLREISASHLPMKGGIAAALAVLAIGSQTILRSDTSGIAQRTYSLVLLPPALHVLPAKSQDVFFANIEKLKQSLDRDRTESPDGD
jgi:type III secretion system (T3SS) inner membrane Yop/YscD-like protein